MIDELVAAVDDDGNVFATDQTITVVTERRRRPMRLTASFLGDPALAPAATLS